MSQGQGARVTCRRHRIVGDNLAARPHNKLASNNLNTLRGTERKKGNRQQTTKTTANMEGRGGGGGRKRSENIVMVMQIILNRSPHSPKRSRRGLLSLPQCTFQGPKGERKGEVTRKELRCGGGGGGAEAEELSIMADCRFRSPCPPRRSDY